MSPARWNLLGVVGVLLLAAAWLAWGLSSSGQRVAQARQTLVGVWTVTEHSGEFPMAYAFQEGAVSRVEVDETLGDLRVHVYVVYADDENAYELGAWSLASLVDDDHAWDAPGFRITLLPPDGIVLTEQPVDGVIATPPWRARGERRKP